MFPPEQFIYFFCPFCLYNTTNIKGIKIIFFLFQMDEKHYKSKAFEMQQIICHLQQQVQFKQKQLVDLTRLSLQYPKTKPNPQQPPIATPAPPVVSSAAPLILEEQVFEINL